MQSENQVAGRRGPEPTKDENLSEPSLAEQTNEAGPANDDQEAARRAKRSRASRPYFVPPGISLDDIPQEMQHGLLEIVQPCYDELVTGAATALERQAGASLTFILFLEVLDQYDLGRLADNLRRSGGIGDERDQQIDRYLRLVKSKQHVASFLFRMQEARLLGQFRNF